MMYSRKDPYRPSVIATVSLICRPYISNKCRLPDRRDEMSTGHDESVLLVVCHFEYTLYTHIDVRKGRRDRRTDGQTQDRCITLTTEDPACSIIVILASNVLWTAKKTSGSPTKLE